MSLGSSSEQDEWLNEERLSLGVGVLKHLPDRQTCQRSLDYPTIPCDVDLHIPNLKYCLQSIWSTYGEFLAEPRNADSLSTMVQVLLRNGQKVVPSCRSISKWQ